MERKYLFDPKLYIANVLSFTRPVATIILMLYIASNGGAAYKWVTVFIWGVIAITDKLDGLAAQHFGSTPNGPTIDEMMDKVTNFVAFLVLASLNRLAWIFVAIMITRDIVVIFIRRRAAKSSSNSPVKAARASGKVKTFLQSILILIAVMPPISYHNKVIFLVSLLATIISVVSGIEILARVLNARNQKSP